MPSQITDLPFEFLLEITLNVTSKEDLCQLRSVNSLFETLATPEIFSSITVRNNKQSPDRFWNLLLTSHIASHIQSISLVEEYTLTENEVGKRLEVAFSILHQAPRLKALELHFFPYYLKVKKLWSNRNILPSLRSLKIDGWLCCDEEHMFLSDKAPIAWFAASLRHLSFTVPGSTSTNKMDSESLEQFWKQVVVRHVLQPAVNLESLVITGRGRGSDGGCFDISQAQLPTFPRLAALSLEHIIWKYDTSGQGDTVALEFIMRHQKTLKKLELHNCAINIRERFGPPHRYWADMYKRLANALTGLVELKVEFELNEDKIPYVYYSSWDYMKKSDFEGEDADLAQDALALEEFRAVVKHVKSRRMDVGSEF